jgi:hypothetical protein
VLADQQVTAVLKVTKIDSEGTTVCDYRPDWLVFMFPIRKPHAPVSAQPNPAIKFVNGFATNISGKILPGHIDISSFRSGKGTEGLFVRGVKGYDGDVSRFGQ